MNHNIDKVREYYLEYFQLFAENAPRQYVDYVGGHDGLPNAMAASLEGLLAFIDLIPNEDAVVMDAGAGVSSYVLRKIFDNVISTDPDLGYLMSVSHVCNIGGVKCRGGYYEITMPEQVTVALRCDYCYYDFGNIQRMPFLKSHVEITEKAMYIDDTDTRDDCREYREMVYSTYGHMNLRDCIEAEDKYGRWGIILTK